MAKKVWTKDAFVRNELRKSFKRYPSYYQCKIAARVSRGAYKCAKCEKLFKEKETEVDHREPVVPINIAGKDQSLEDYVNRLFVEVDKLDCLCKPCHKEKSSREMSLRKEERAKKKVKK
jgi:hypothetical protein